MSVFLTMTQLCVPYTIRKNSTISVCPWYANVSPSRIVLTITAQLEPPINVFLSHDWPNTIERYGDMAALLEEKPNWREDIDRRTLGSPVMWDFLTEKQPEWWVSGHMHVRFEARVRHQYEDDDWLGTNAENQDVKETNFLALDKYMQGHHFLEVCTPLLRFWLF